MRDIKNLLISPSATIRDALEKIDAAGMQIVLVADEKGRLVGTITDGDVRRGLLRGIGLDKPVASVMNRNPTAAHVSQDREWIKALMTKKLLHQIPIIDDEGRVVDLVEVLDELVAGATRENWVVLMAGGLGTRLRPLTDNTPKPMLPIGERPLIEDIVSRLVQFGFRRIFISVNYKGEMIKAHFGNRHEPDVQITFLEEPTRLGTGGALSLLPSRPQHPFLVINADLVTNVNYDYLLDFHVHHSSQAIMCVREYDVQVPYGVVRLDDHRITSIEEKPTHRFFINAGIYLLEPSVLDYVEPRVYMDMPTLFEKLIRNGVQTCAFPIREYWLDIGRLDDLERARNEYGRTEH